MSDNQTTDHRLRETAFLPTREDRMEEALRRIADWSEAYPTDIFPEPHEAYYQKAREVLEANGMTLDRLSAAAMRHVASGMGRIAKEALNHE